MVKLHHPLTTLQIGETLLLHFLSIDEMVFELAQGRGKYLKAKSNGTVGKLVHSQVLLLIC